MLHEKYESLKLLNTFFLLKFSLQFSTKFLEFLHSAYPERLSTSLTPFYLLSVHAKTLETH